MRIGATAVHGMHTGPMHMKGIANEIRAGSEQAEAVALIFRQ